MNVPKDVIDAFRKWEEANRWQTTLTRQEGGRLGAAKKALNAALRKNNLTFRLVAAVMLTGGVSASDIEPK